MRDKTYLELHALKRQAGEQRHREKNWLIFVGPQINSKNPENSVWKICLLIFFTARFFLVLAFNLPEWFLTPPILTLPKSFTFANILSSYLVLASTAPLSTLIHAALGLAQPCWKDAIMHLLQHPSHFPQWFEFQLVSVKYFFSPSLCFPKDQHFCVIAFPQTFFNIPKLTLGSMDRWGLIWSPLTSEEMSIYTHGLCIKSFAFYLLSLVPLTQPQLLKSDYYLTDPWQFKVLYKANCAASKIKTKTATVLWNVKSAASQY